jgi:hypothetical protein
MSLYGNISIKTNIEIQQRTLTKKVYVDVLRAYDTFNGLPEARSYHL